MKYGYVYLTTNCTNNHKYIGRHKSTSFDSTYKGSGKILVEALQKYGKDNFHVELIEWCSNEDELNARERYWIAYYNAAESDNFYNLSNGGQGFGGLSGERSPTKRQDVRKKMSENHADVSGEKNPNYGKTMSREQREKISQTKRRNADSVGCKNPMYGRTHSDEVKQRLRELRKSNPCSISKPGKDNPNYGTVHINNGIVSKRCKKEDLQKFISMGWHKGRLVKNA